MRCELCAAPLKWIYTGVEWVPCDEAPTLVYPDGGAQKAIYKKEFVQCTHYDGVRNVAPVYAHLPHALTCKRLRKKEDER